jgi:hypothetical protein
MRAEGETSVCEATVKVRAGAEHAHTVADGDGPVNALDAALRAALVKFYPRLAAVRLTDYKVRIVDSSVGTAARTRVLIESRDETSTRTTVGVHENIIEASLQALVDSFDTDCCTERPPAHHQPDALVLSGRGVTRAMGNARRLRRPGIRSTVSPGISRDTRAERPQTP